jgi:hypothetical protein
MDEATVFSTMVFSGGKKNPLVRKWMKATPAAGDLYDVCEVACSKNGPLLESFRERASPARARHLLDSFEEANIYSDQLYTINPPPEGLQHYVFIGHEEPGLKKAA